MIAGLGTGDLVPRKTTVVERPRKITLVDPGFQCPRKGGAERPKLKGINAQIYRSPFSNFGSFVLLLLAPISVSSGLLLLPSWLISVSSGLLPAELSSRSAAFGRRWCFSGLSCLLGVLFSALRVHSLELDP